jgi:hypothetical protein
VLLVPAISNRAKTENTSFFAVVVICVNPEAALKRGDYSRVRSEMRDLKSGRRIGGRHLRDANLSSPGMW